MANAWLTPREASDYARVTPITLKRAVNAGTLPAFRVNGGRLLRYRREDLDETFRRYLPKDQLSEFLKRNCPGL